MRIAVVAVAVLCTMLAGCTNGVDENGAGQSATGYDKNADASFARNGAWNPGTPDQHRFDCDGDARFYAFINGAGNVEINVRDAAGLVIGQAKLNGSGQSTENKQVDGLAGEWTLEAIVKPGSPYYSGFSGQYSASVTC